MACLFCGNEISLTRRIADPDFCCADHRKRHSAGMRRGLSRLMEEAIGPAEADRPLPHPGLLVVAPAALVGVPGAERPAVIAVRVREMIAPIAADIAPAAARWTGGLRRPALPPPSEVPPHVKAVTNRFSGSILSVGGEPRPTLRYSEQVRHAGVVPLAALPCPVTHHIRAKAPGFPGLALAVRRQVSPAAKRGRLALLRPLAPALGGEILHPRTASIAPPALFPSPVAQRRPWHFMPARFILQPHPHRAFASDTAEHTSPTFLTGDSVFAAPVLLNPTAGRLPQPATRPCDCIAIPQAVEAGRIPASRHTAKRWPPLGRSRMRRRS